MGNLHKVEGDKLDQSRKEAESEDNLHRQVQIFVIYDLLLVIVPNEGTDGCRMQNELLDLSNLDIPALSIEG